ncbi:hypothetical protein MYAM1_002853 [Malassezia yamatoensis]|uniref:Uncharacterized protein n=1 Tax=Malassezia yamatoensis TaxID=253288 RepID=A0AAJ6CJU1_9BASI|nr:hypothetical protein MYAM1_002853 [Malassezia yamatoensis]
MLRIAGIAAQLNAIVQSNQQQGGADCAVLSMYQTAEMYAYATREPSLEPSPSKSSFMAIPTEHPLMVGEERACMYSAIAVSAWRDHVAKSGRQTPLARMGMRAKMGSSPELRSQPPRRFPSVQRTETMSASDTLTGPDSSGSHGPMSDSTEPNLDSESGKDTETTPLLLECEHGRLFIMPVLVSNLASSADFGMKRRSQRSSLARQDRSRRPSHAGSSDAAPNRPSPAFLRLTGGITDDATTDAGFSTEEELPSGADTDKDSVRSGSVLRNGDPGTVMLLSLHTPLLSDPHSPYDLDTNQVWHTLQCQAVSFAEANACLS